MASGSELEALVAHIYVVGGRMIGSPPPGAVAVIAPKRAARPRQDETVFVLLVPSGSVKAQAQVYQSLAQQLADLYFKTSGGITGGLREALTKLNQHILQEQKRMVQPLRASLVCGIMREQEVYLARCGPMMAAFRHGKSINTFPGTRTSESLSLSPPLGASMEPRLELSHFELEPDCMLLFADSAFTEASDDDLKTALLTGNNISDVLEPLRGLVTAPLGHAMVIQFVTEDTPTPEFKPMPVRPLDVQPAKTAPLTEPEAPEKPTAPKARKKSSSRRWLSPTRKVLAKGLSGVAGVTEKVGSRISQEMPAVEVPTETPITPTEEETVTQPPPLLSNLIVLVAVLIPLVIIVVVIGLALSQTGSTDYEICRVNVLALRDSARQLTPGEGATLNDENTARAREEWESVMAEALSCERNKPGDEEMLLTAGEAQNNLDRFDRVVRRDVISLRRFTPGADLRGPISGNWISLYTLDRAADEVYHDTLSQDGSTLTSVSETPLIFKGQSIGGEIVGDLVDIEYMERGGLPSGNSNVPITMDESGLLIWYSETFGENETLRLVVPSTWTRPIAIAVWQLNFYVLDADGQQIWRFVPNEGIYSDLPQEYFFGEARPDLSNAVDFGIDEDGNIFIAFSDGHVEKYLGGESQSFDLFNLPANALTHASSLYVDNNPLSRGLVITDPVTATLYATSLGGTVNQGYRPINPLNAFEGISGAIVNAETNSVYVLAGDYLYHMRRLQ